MMGDQEAERATAGGWLWGTDTGANGGCDTSISESHGDPGAGSSAPVDQARSDLEPTVDVPAVRVPRVDVTPVDAPPVDGRAVARRPAGSRELCRLHDRQPE